MLQIFKEALKCWEWIKLCSGTCHILALKETRKTQSDSSVMFCTTMKAVLKYSYILELWEDYVHFKAITVFQNLRTRNARSFLIATYLGELSSGLLFPIYSKCTEYYEGIFKRSQRNFRSRRITLTISVVRTCCKHAQSKNNSLKENSVATRTCCQSVFYPVHWQLVDHHGLLLWLPDCSVSFQNSIHTVPM